MFEKCNWTKYLINIPKYNYQSNNMFAVTFVLIFLSLCYHNIYILIVTSRVLKSSTVTYQLLFWSIIRQLFKTALITRPFKQLESHLQQLKTNYVKQDLISLTASKIFKSQTYNRSF